MGQTNRRQFIQASAVAGVGFYAGTAAAGDKQDKEKSPVERLKFACVGVGGKGSSDTDHVARLGDVVAICDCDENSLNAKGKTLPRAAKFFDFREMLGKLGRQIDAVVVSTPDHTHAPAAAMAIRMGKHVYCQKPLTHSVHEARRLRELAREFKVCTQMGNQGTASDQFRTSVELLRSGALGTISDVHVWTNRPIWPQAPGVTRRPEGEEVPANVHWDLFLGPAPQRPYNRAYHPFRWRGWRDFGTGALGDMACHTANMPYMGLRLGLPTRISAESDEVNPETYPGWAKVEYEFTVASQRTPIKLTWYEGRRNNVRVLPGLDLIPGEREYSASGSLIVGQNASVYSPDDYGGTRRLIGQGAGDIRIPKETMPRHGRGNSDEHQKREWVAAIRKGDYRIALSNFDYAGMLTESILLGNVAIVAGRRLEYDGEKMAFNNDTNSNRLLQRTYRTGWRL